MWCQNRELDHTELIHRAIYGDQRDCCNSLLQDTSNTNVQLESHVPVPRCKPMLLAMKNDHQRDVICRRNGKLTTSACCMFKKNQITKLKKNIMCFLSLLNADVGFIDAVAAAIVVIPVVAISGTALDCSWRCSSNLSCCSCWSGC